MKELQQTIPVLFELLSPPTYFPRKLMCPILNEIMKKATAPFESGLQSKSKVFQLSEEDELKSLCFFPSLPCVRPRRCYEADTDSKAVICTKKSTAHPSLTPGIFTLFCHHGKHARYCT